MEQKMSKESQVEKYQYTIDDYNKKYSSAIQQDNISSSLSMTRID